MRKFIFILLTIIALVFFYYKFIRNTTTKEIEYYLTTTPISKIVFDPRNYDGQEVSIYGKVTSSFNLDLNSILDDKTKEILPLIDLTKFNLGVKCYVLNDKMGNKIYVITEKAVPKEGEVVKVKGIFNQRLKIGNLQVETITEK